MAQIAQELVALDVATNAKGQKTAPIFRKGGASALWLIPGNCRPLFDPSAFKQEGKTDNVRLSLCLSASEEGIRAAMSIDEWAVAYALDHSEQFFGKKLTWDQVMDRYSAPIVKQSEKYPPYIKIKTCSEGRGVPTFWNTNKQRRDPPTCWTDVFLKPSVRIVGFWFMGSAFGLTLQLQDALVVSENATVCPF